MELEDIPFQILREITDNFSDERKLGEGAFGAVYRGVTKTKTDVAVKKLKNTSNSIDNKDFKNEIYNLATLKHENIVQVIGYCYEIEKKTMDIHGQKLLLGEPHRAICLEYLHNGSLENHLSDEFGGLDWDTRFKIIKGTCQGLKYILNDLEEPIYHLDLKPLNILLDNDMVPKIADFGLSRIFGKEQVRTTQNVYGTLCYRPPEYIDRGEISNKFDIFSLGIVMIRIISGPEGNFKCGTMSSDEFIDQVKKNWRNRLETTCSSDSLIEAYCHQVETCVQIALECAENDSKKRPHIVNITNKLHEIEAYVSKLLPQTSCHERIGTALSKQETQMRKKSEEIPDNFIDARETSSDVIEELILGRSEATQEIIASLHERTRPKIIILPICGIGGIGKTTFAKLIYNHTDFKSYSHVWIYVSQRFDLEKIRNSIFSQLLEKDSQTEETHMAHNHTRLISGKRILIVLDDLWQNDTLVLEDLKDMLNLHESISTTVLVTTRCEQIAEKICMNHKPYKLQPLSNDVCWDIIKQRSGFEVRDDKERLKGIGQEIALKCDGVALAAQSLGFMLRSMEYDQWMEVKDSKIWNESTSDDACLTNQVIASLKLSYNSMTQSLRSCFTYCAIFPKGHKIVKSDLVNEWISLDFIKPTKMFNSMQLCEKYIAQLLGLSFLKYSISTMTYEEPYNEKQNTLFTMHDLVHDLAVLILGDEIMDQSKQVNTLSSCCRYALLTDSSKPLELCLPSCASLTAVRFIDCRRTELHSAAFTLANSLRVLDISECHIQKLPESIGQLQQLRYLKAPEIHNQLIPDCITKLSELNYLDIRGSEISALPDSIGEMTDLVHLDMSSCSEIEQLPVSFSNLENLVHLDLSNCSRITGVSESLGSLRQLQHLDLSFCKSIGEQLPEALGSLTELQYLNLSNCSYLQVPEAEVLGNLSKLKHLNLSSRLSPLRRLPEALGSFTALEYLNLKDCRQLEELPTSFGKLCSLVHLNLSNCFCLNNIWDALRALIKLQYLNLHQCSIKVSSEDLSIKGLEEAMGKLTELRLLDLSNSVYLIYGGQSAVDMFVQEWISNLTNLEHLNLGNNHEIHTLPDAFGELKKLHTLELSHCSSLQRLPKSISESDSLKFLNTIDCDELDKSTLPQFKSNSVLLPHFVVHTGDGEYSSNLVLLKDEDPPILEISRLENVKSAEEAKMIKLLDKQKITELKFKWTRDAERFVQDKEVLTELMPPSSLEDFELHGYSSLTFPSWMMGITSYLPQLSSVSLEELPLCSALPPLGQLPNLSCLTIKHMHSIREIGRDFYGGKRPFPALEQFYVCYMDNLQEWDTICYSDDDDANVLVFPRLYEWVIRQCPILSFKPCPPLCGGSGMQWLIETSDNVMSSGPEQMHVDIAFNSDIVVTTCGLEVRSCQLPLHQWRLLLDLPALSTLYIDNCSDLTCNSLDILGGLSSLQKLKVIDCESITELPDCLGDLTSLVEISIFNCPGIKRLPESIKQLTNLQDLTISNDCSLELAQWCLSDEKIMEILSVAERRQSRPTVWYVLDA